MRVTLKITPDHIGVLLQHSEYTFEKLAKRECLTKLTGESQGVSIKRFFPPRMSRQRCFEIETRCRLLIANFEKPV
jgi:hypothetical protein